MTREETKQVLAILRTAYPRFYERYSKEELCIAVNLWFAALQEFSFENEIRPALKEVVQNLKFPPTVADLVEAARSKKPEPLDGMAEMDRKYSRNVQNWHKRQSRGEHIRIKKQENTKCKTEHAAQERGDVQ